MPEKHHPSLVIPQGGIPKFTNPVEQRKWQLEHHVAAFRYFARVGFLEGTSGRISMRDLEHKNTFWVNPLFVPWALMQVSDLIQVDVDNKRIGGNPTHPIDENGFTVHAAIYALRPDVNSVAHTHTIYGKTWSTFGRTLDMLTQDICKVYKAHAVYGTYGGIVYGKSEGEKIANTLGLTNKALLLQSHGLLTVGNTVDEAAYMFGVVDRGCQVQLLAESVGPRIVIEDDQALGNFKYASGAEFLYDQFQPYYLYELLNRMIRITPESLLVEEDS
ncbi:hypothetical protein G7Y89_g9910 [Cudoniella acicularis]|uniref:Class II aldolase/adducin N-terminal domain-containing protein n=1 Tax=Cudoniella acicularis TaxID=354080 RepID=A0A8H4W246_9HELO|nr:hypothetical protein G7Y89_g9910 [Cudoniella acicularis]